MSNGSDFISMCGSLMKDYMQSIEVKTIIFLDELLLEEIYISS